jgi:tetratricopeptide (TPR) repeat protein
VVNVNPLFHGGTPDREAMEIFPFDPGRIHFVPRSVALMYELGLDALSAGDIAGGGPLLESAAALDPLSARGQLGVGLARRAAGQIRRAEESFRRAIALQPDLREAQIALDEINAERTRRSF